MNSYRLYLTDAQGHFQRVALLECHDDAAAIAEAERRAAGQSAELWQAGRMVKTWRAVAAQALD